MNFRRWKYVAELIGIISIVASLIFVGFQLRQGQQSLESEVIFGEMIVFQELLSRIDQNAELAEALALARDDPASLTAGQRIQAKAWLEEWLAQVATYSNLNRRGLFSDAELSRRIGNECWAYNDFRILLDEIRKRRDFGWATIERFCSP